MARCRVGEKKVSLYCKKTGLPVVAALVRGGTDHRIDLCLEDGVVVHWYKDGTMEKSEIGHAMISPDKIHDKKDYIVPEFISRK